MIFLHGNPNTEVMKSTDGTTWTKHTLAGSLPSGTERVDGVSPDNSGGYVATTNFAFSYKSSDGITWGTRVNIGGSGPLKQDTNLTSGNISTCTNTFRYTTNGGTSWNTPTSDEGTNFFREIIHLGDGSPGTWLTTSS